MAVSLLAIGLTGCSSPSDTGSEPVDSTSRPTTSQGIADEMYTVQAQPNGDLKAITFDPEAMPMGQAVFEGNLTSNEDGCISLESANGMTLLAFSVATFTEISDSGELELSGKRYEIGQAVSVVGGTTPVRAESLTDCGDPHEITVVSTLTKP